MRDPAPVRHTRETMTALKDVPPRPLRSPRRIACIAMALSLPLAAPARASDNPGPGFGIGLEGGGLWFARNDARIPGDAGTEFDVTAFTGSDALPFTRIGAHWYLNDRHSVHLVYAPLRVADTGTLARDTAFDGETFQAGEAEGTYQFNAYKLTYRYTFTERGPWRWGVGFTGVVRDAEIGLRRGETVAVNDNVGFVPTLHLAGRYRFDDRWALRLEFDGLAGGPGRLFDIALKLDRNLGEHWQLSAGYRTLEGGAETDEVFNFAWLNYAAAEIRYRF